MLPLNQMSFTNSWFNSWWCDNAMIWCHSRSLFHIRDVKQRTRAENEFLKTQHNSIVIQLNAELAQLHKKCDFANFTLIFCFKLNSDDKRNKSHISFICFQNVAFQCACCINMHSMKNNENERKDKSHTSPRRSRNDSTCWSLLKRLLLESFLCHSVV